MNEIKKLYWPNGELLLETPYMNGKMHGVRKWYYKDGRISTSAKYICGIENGLEIQNSYTYPDIYIEYKKNGYNFGLNLYSSNE